MEPQTGERNKGEEALLIFRGSQYSALSDAHRWCRENGVSHAPLVEGYPIALGRGEQEVPTWSKIPEAALSNLDGVIFGDYANGPVMLALRRRLPVADGKASLYTDFLVGRFEQLIRQINAFRPVNNRPLAAASGTRSRR